MKPYFDTHVFCCVNQRSPGHPRGCCQDKGAATLRNYMKDRAHDLGLKNVRINGALCLDRCELGPTMVIYPEGVWYTYRNKADIDEILTSHLLSGRPVARLLLGPEDGPKRQP